MGFIIIIVGFDGGVGQRIISKFKSDVYSGINKYCPVFRRLQYFIKFLSLKNSDYLPFCKQLYWYLQMHMKYTIFMVRYSYMRFSIQKLQLTKEFPLQFLVQDIKLRQPQIIKFQLGDLTKMMKPVTETFYHDFTS